MKGFSRLAGNLRGQEMFRILSAARALEQEGRDIIHLEIGDPDFDSPPNVVEAACNAIREGHTHYTTSSGLQEFRERAARMTERSRGFRPGIDQILVTPGGNIQLYLAIACLTDPGDEVIIPDPGFVSYAAIIELCGARPVRVPLQEKQGFRIDPDAIRQAITPRTRLIVVNSPHNPTGAVMNAAEAQAIYTIAEEQDVYLLSDEVYGRMVYADAATHFASPCMHDGCRERTILVHSFSKSYAMTGWRIGAVTAPAGLCARMTLLLETITSCVSPFVQHAAIEAMSGSQKYVEQMMEAFRERRDMFVAGLNRLPGISCSLPGGAFYAFADIRKTGMSSEAFAQHLLLNANIAACPGNYFGPAGEGYVRFCYAKDKARLQEALLRMQALFGVST